MAVYDLSDLIAKLRTDTIQVPAATPATTPGLLAAVRELQGLTFNLLDGAAADTNIAVTDIATDDTVVFCIHISTKAAIATMADITSEVVILSAGNIQLTTTSTTSDQLLLIWFNKDKA